MCASQFFALRKEALHVVLIKAIYDLSPMEISEISFLFNTRRGNNVCFGNATRMSGKFHGSLLSGSIMWQPIVEAARRVLQL